MGFEVIRDVNMYNNTCENVTAFRICVLSLIIIIYVNSVNHVIFGVRSFKNILSCCCFVSQSSGYN